jgi:NADPH:quinone reductase-like Zn-dependent oxidoreductase
MGAHVTAVVSGRNEALARQLGADAVIDYTTTDFSKGDARFDVVFDAVGKSSFGRARRVLERGGLYMTTVLGAGILFQSLWTRLPFVRRRARIALTGLRKPPEKVADLAQIRAWAEDGVIVPVIDARFSLADAADAHRLVESGRKRGHAVLELVPAA